MLVTTIYHFIGSEFWEVSVSGLKASMKLKVVELVDQYSFTNILGEKRGE